MCRPSRLTLEGRPCVVMVVEPGLRWTRQRRVRKCGQGGLLSVSPKLRADERRCQVRLVIRSAATCTTSSKPVATSEPCVRQNRVVLAVVATVKPLRRRHSRQPARCPRLSLGRGRPTGTRLPGEHGISRKATAQGRPSDLATPVCCCAVSLRYTFAQRTAGASRHPAFPAPSWTREWRDQAKLGRNAPRGREGVSASSNVHWRMAMPPLARNDDAVRPIMSAAKRWLF
ncbi:hypothetical protein ACVWYI_001223 [Bradyrhizobium sp. LB13.1]